jgi:hypothetical protein
MRITLCISSKPSDSSDEWHWLQKALTNPF